MTITLVGSSRELRNRNFLPPIDLLDLLAANESADAADTKKTSARDNSPQLRKVCMGPTLAIPLFARNFSCVSCGLCKLWIQVLINVPGVLRLFERSI